MASLPFKDKKTRISTRGGSRSFRSQWAMFFRQFMKHPGMIGSVIPSSSQLVARSLDGVDSVSYTHLTLPTTPYV